MIKFFKSNRWLLVLILVGFFIRIIPIFSSSISFHYDMSRDAFLAEQIYRDHHLKILGPPTSKDGLFHGVLYYYLIAPFYALTQGDPHLLAYFFAFLNIIAIVPLYILSKDIFNSKKLGFLTAFLFTFSFEATQYSIWLSDPAPAVLTSILFFFGLYYWSKGKRWGFILAAFSAAMSAQFEFFLIYLFLVIILFKFIFKVKTTKKDIVASILAALIALSTIIASVVKFGTLNRTLKAFQSLGESKATQDANFTDLFINYVSKSSVIFTNNFFPVNVFIGGLIMLVVLYFIFKDKQKFILFGLLSSVIIFLFGGHSNIYANIGLLVPVFLGMTYLINKIWKTNKNWAYTFVSIIFLANIYSIIKAFPKAQYLLVIPQDMILSKELAVIDKTYQLANGQPFSINSLTVPLWTNTTWAYLYHYYGEKKYGYLPTFYGNDPVGSLGAEVVKKTQKPEEKLFFIIEPLRGIPANISESEFNREDGRTLLKNEYNFGDLRIQEREIKDATESTKEKKTD